MKYFSGRSASAALMAAAVSMRMFWGLTVEETAALNAAWMCPLLGFVIALPLLFAIHQASKTGQLSPWQNLSGDLPSALQKPFAALWALLLLYDAAAVLRMTAASSNIIALGDVTVHLLIVPLGITVAILILLGPAAAGNSARIALRILPLFLLILLIVQLNSYRIAWLTPLLGAGVRGIASGGVYCAGCLALMSLIWLPAFPDRNRKGIYRYMLFSCIGVSVLLLCFQMSFPVMPEEEFTRAARMELILSNGRMSLSPQFILNVLWYGGMLYLLAANALGAAVYLRILLNRLPLWLLAVSEALAISIVGIFNPDWLQNSAQASRVYFPLIGAAFALLMLLQWIRKRGDVSCENAE